MFDILLNSNITDKQKKALKGWKYSASEESFLDTYFYQPWWNFCASLPPSWISPNALTLIGCLWMWAYTAIESYYNPKMDDISATPRWVYLVIGVFHFIGHTCDGIDGKVARKTGLTGPVGELLDHGLDCINHHCLIMTVASIFSFHVFNSVWLRVGVILTLQANVVTLHIYKLFCGTLVLPPNVDASHLLVTIVLVLFYSYGLDECMTAISTPFFSLRGLVLFLTLVATWFNSSEFIYRSLTTDRPNKTESNISLLIRSILPFAINIAIFLAWNHQTDILSGVHGTWTVRSFWFAQGFKHCCLMYRLLFASQVEDELATRLPILFYVDALAVIVLSNHYPTHISTISTTFAFFCGFQYFFGMYSLVAMLADHLSFPLISTVRPTKFSNKRQ